MKKALSIILAILMLCSLVVVGVSAQDNNLLLNGSFNTTALSNWWMRGDWNGGSWNYTHNEGVDGTGALILTGVGAGTADQNAGLFYTPEVPNEFGFVPMAGESYKVSFMVYYAEGSHGDVYIDINEGALGSGHAAGNSGWNGVEFTFTAPSDDAVKLRLVANSFGDGEKIVVDDISVVSISGNHLPDPSLSGGAELDLTTELLGDNLLINGEFNSAATSKWWFRTDWNGGYFMHQANGGVDDTGCIVANGLGSGQPFENAGAFYTGQEGVENYLQLKEGVTYQLDVDLYRPEGYTGNLYVDVNEGGCAVAGCTTNGEWQHISTRFIGVKDPVKVRIVANALPTGGVAYVDNIMIREVGAEPTAVEDEGTKEVLPTIQAAVDYSAVVEEEVVEEVVEETSFPVWAIIVIVAVVVLAGGAVAFVFIKKKKGGKAE